MKNIKNLSPVDRFHVMVMLCYIMLCYVMVMTTENQEPLNWCISIHGYNCLSTPLVIKTIFVLEKIIIMDKPSQKFSLLFSKRHLAFISAYYFLKCTLGREMLIILGKGLKKSQWDIL